LIWGILRRINISNGKIVAELDLSLNTLGRWFDYKGTFNEPWKS